MEEHFRARLAAELDDGVEPPLGDLVPGALRQGRRLRFVRRTKITASALVAAGVLAVGVLAGGPLFNGHGSVVGTAGNHTPGANLTVGPAPTGSDPAVPSGNTLPATPATLAYRLQQLLPPGAISHVTSLPIDPVTNVRLHLTTGHGTGMVYLAVYNGTLNCVVGTCGTQHGVRTSLILNGDNCIQSQIVEVAHSDGVLVEVDLSTCLDEGGAANLPAAQILTTQQAIALAADPSWGLRMNAPLVTAGGQKYPELVGIR